MKRFDATVCMPLVATFLFLTISSSHAEDRSTPPTGSSLSKGVPHEKVTARTPKVELLTSMGKIVLELDSKKAPLTVANFLKYVKSGHYNGTIFHRVINNFMIQGGGFDTAYQEKKTRGTIQNEADNGLTNTLGTIAMARTPEPHSASAQFFINVKDNDNLNYREKSIRGWGYAVFGKVIRGMDVVDKIKETPTGAKGPFSTDAPQKEVVIIKARLL